MHCIRTITPWSVQGNADTIKQLAQQQPTKCIHNVLLHTNQANTCCTLTSSIVKMHQHRLKQATGSKYAQFVLSSGRHCPNTQAVSHLRCQLALRITILPSICRAATTTFHRHVGMLSKLKTEVLEEKTNMHALQHKHTAVQRITCAQIRTPTQLPIGKKQHKVRRVCVAMLGADLGWSVCVSDRIQQNIIHNTVFARMMSRVVITMA